MQNVLTQTPIGASAGWRPRSWVVRELALPAGFVAAILATNYALAGLPNVKLFDLLVFVAGYTLGFRRGAAVAAAAWLVYGQINPWGVAHFQLLVTLIAAETLYAGAGALARRLLRPEQVRLLPGPAALALFAGAALVTTAAYDVLTNVYTGYFWATIAGANEYSRWISVALFNPGALFFMLLHVGSNLALFPVFGPLLIRGAERAKRDRER